MPQAKLDSIGKKLTKVTSQQNYFQARESRHRRTLESNLRRVDVVVATGVFGPGGCGGHTGVRNQEFVQD